MPKFDTESNCEIFRRCQIFRVNARKAPVRPLPRFGRAKDSYRYVEFGREIANSVINTMVEHGLPIRMEMQGYTVHICKPALWSPLGIRCDLDGRIATYSVSDPKGALPLYINALRMPPSTTDMQIAIDVENKRQQIRALTQQYNEEVLRLVGPAMVSLFCTPNISFIDYSKLGPDVYNLPVDGAASISAVVHEWWPTPSPVQTQTVVKDTTL